MKNFLGCFNNCFDRYQADDDLDFDFRQQVHIHLNTTVVGVNTGISHGYVDYMFLLVFLGTITGVGGGLLRDIMAGVPPYILVRHIYACASIVGAIVCVVLYRHFGAVASMVGASAVVVLIRYLAAHYRWNLPKLTRKEEN